jgi:hypothetical protein
MVITLQFGVANHKKFNFHPQFLPLITFQKRAKIQISALTN